MQTAEHVMRGVAYYSRDWVLQPVWSQLKGQRTGNECLPSTVWETL